MQDIASSIYNARRIRDEIFAYSDIFGEPTWEMLLDLAIAEEDGRRLSISDLCIGSCCASTTALRYIKAMEKSGLITREDDWHDGRRTYVRLSAKGRDMFQRFHERTQVSDGDYVLDRVKCVAEG